MKDQDKKYIEETLAEVRAAADAKFAAKVGAPVGAGDSAKNAAEASAMDEWFAQDEQPAKSSKPTTKQMIEQATAAAHRGECGVGVGTVQWQSADGTMFGVTIVLTTSAGAVLRRHFEVGAWSYNESQFNKRLKAAS